METVQSENQHILLSLSLFTCTTVEKQDFDSLFSFVVAVLLHFPRSRLKYPNFMTHKKASFLAMEEVLSAILSIKNNFQDKRVVIGSDQKLLLRTEGFFCLFLQMAISTLYNILFSI